MRNTQAGSDSSHSFQLVCCGFAIFLLFQGLKLHTCSEVKRHLQRCNFSLTDQSLIPCIYDFLGSDENDINTIIILILLLSKDIACKQINLPAHVINHNGCEEFKRKLLPLAQKRFFTENNVLSKIKNCFIANEKFNNLIGAACKNSCQEEDIIQEALNYFSNILPDRNELLNRLETDTYFIDVNMTYFIFHLKERNHKTSSTNISLTDPTFSNIFINGQFVPEMKLLLKLISDDPKKTPDHRDYTEALLSLLKVSFPMHNRIEYIHIDQLAKDMIHILSMSSIFHNLVYKRPTSYVLDMPYDDFTEGIRQCMDVSVLGLLEIGTLKPIHHHNHNKRPLLE